MVAQLGLQNQLSDSSQCLSPDHKSILEDDEYEDDMDAGATTNTSAASAARARKRISDSFKQLANVCGCSRSKRPGALR